MSDRIATRDLESANGDCQRRVTVVDDRLESRFGNRPAWQAAREQQERIGLLIFGGLEKPGWFVCDGHISEAMHVPRR